MNRSERMNKKMQKAFAILMIMLMVTTIFSSGGRVYAKDEITAPIVDQGNELDNDGNESANPDRENDKADSTASEITEVEKDLPLEEAAPVLEERNNHISPVRERREVSGNQAIIEASILSSNNSQIGELSDPKSSLEVSNFAKLNLHIHAVFPIASNKNIDISLPYGMMWNTDFQFNRTLGWVGELKDGGVIAPKDQSEMAKQPITVYGIPFGGTLTLQFQDTTKEVEFDIPISIGKTEPPRIDVGLENIPDAVKVAQHYNDGQDISKEISTDLTVIKLYPLHRIGFAKNYDSLLNERGHIEIGLDSPAGTGHKVAWIAGVTRTYILSMLEDYYLAMLAPEKAEYLGVYHYDGDYMVKDEEVKILGPGEVFEKSTGESYTVPAGKKLYVWQRKNNLTLPINEQKCSFEPMWRFPKEDFPVGTVVEISQMDVGVKYYNPEGNGKYLPYDENLLATMTYEISDQKRTFMSIPRWKT